MNVATAKTVQPAAVAVLMRKVKALAKEYRALTGRPLGVTGEVAEWEVCRLLGLEMAEVRQAGYDAVRRTHGGICRVQIKGRCLAEDCKPGQRVGRIDLNKPWDIVALILMDQDWEPLEIWEAPRTAIEKTLVAPGSIARNVRGALGVPAFKRIGKRVWAPETPKSS
jgi:hypothetical protein